MSAAPRERITFGRYQTITVLGEGGMASVYLAHPIEALAANKLLVVKSLRPELARHESIRRMFLDEGRLAARLNHRNVVQLFEVAEDGDEHFLTMEYLDGQPYSQVTTKIDQLALHLTVLCEVLAGLHYAHELTDFDGTPLRVVHRDVSPHNVFLTYDGLVKVVDFGIAKAADATTSTESGVFKGKAAYASPEQVTADRVDRRADVFAVGVMLWEALAKERFWATTPNAAIFARLLGGEWRPLAEVAPDAPAELVAITDRALTLRAEDRYPTAEAMRLEIEQYMRTNGLMRTPHQLGAAVTEAFAEERRAVRGRIESYMRASRDGSASSSGGEPVIPRSEGSGSGSARRRHVSVSDVGAPGTDGGLESPGSMRADSATRIEGTAARRTWRSRAKWGAAAVALTGAAAVAAVLGGRGAAPEARPAAAGGPLPGTATASGVSQGAGTATAEKPATAVAALAPGSAGESAALAGRDAGVTGTGATGDATAALAPARKVPTAPHAAPRASASGRGLDIDDVSPYAK